MIRRAFVCAVTIVMAAADTSLAQPKAPIGRFVVDLQVASAGLPTAEGWTPAVPQGTVVPSRGLGLQAGAHIFVAKYRWGALGVGASWMNGRGATSPEAPADRPTGTPAPTLSPDVTTRVTSLTPQLSMNFGHSLGWSYLSAGYGLTNVTSERTAVTGGAPAQVLESGRLRAINFGGGARWFLTDRLGVGFDLRWHRLPVIADRAFAGRASLLTAAVGLSIKEQ